MSRVFDGVPDEGASVDWGGARFDVLRVVSATVSGERIWSVRLSGTCAECGAAFECTAGDAAKWLRKRCETCDPKGEADKLERQAWVSRGRAERMRAAKAAKAAALIAGPVAAEAPTRQVAAALECRRALVTEVSARGTRLRGVATFSDGAELPFGYGRDGTTVLMPDGSSGARYAAAMQPHFAELDIRLELGA